jgi:iron(III) transport system permease protein
MEMAKQNGVRFLRRQLHITLPHLSPAVGGGMLLVLLYALADFGVPALLRLPTFSTTIYSRFAGDVDRAGAALLSLPLMAITVVLLLIQDRMFGQGVIQIARSWVPQRMVQLGRYAILIYIFLGFSILLSVGTPLGMLTFWLLSSVSAAEQASFVPFGQLAVITAQTVAYTILISSIIIIIAIVCARTLRHAGKLGYLLSRIAQIGYALPGIVVALSVVLVSTRLLPVTLAGVFPLGIALFIRFIPQAIQGIDVAMLQITPTIEDAGRSMGQNVYQVLRNLIVPLSSPGIQTTWSLVFLGILKELPATLILRPAGFDTLAVRVWMPTSDGFTAAAALPAILMVLCALIPFGVIFRTQRTTPDRTKTPD